MKAILVIDIPDFINSVTKGILKPIGAVGKLEIGYGSDDGEMIRFEFINTDGALLKPMPQKNKYDVEKYATVDYENNVNLGHYLNKGWNDCIDEILGEDND